MTDSQKLIREYVESCSEGAFRELVTRYIDLVHSAALRLVGGDSHLAEDVVQTVFADLARMAQTLSSDVMLGGWLHQHTCFVASKTIRGERRRQSRERQAVEMNALQEHSDMNFSQVAPILDEAINELAEPDRTAILLRFFEQHDFCRIGETIGSSGDAARMRVARALEKLELQLKRRGITSTAAALSVVLSANAVQTAPVGLATSISTAALAGTGLSTSTAISATKMIAMTTFQKTLVAATLAVVAGIGTYEAHQTSRLHEELRTLQQPQTPLAERIRLLQQERDEATNRLASLTEENGRLKSNAAELLKLRSEVTRMRNQLHDLAQTRPADTEKENELETEAKRLATKAQLLKQLFTKMPEKSIPELQYLGAQSWLDRAKLADLETDAGIVKVLSELRYDAKNFFAAVGMIPALQGYAEANGGQLPTDISQLKPYFANVGAGDDVLQRYQIVKTGTVNNLQPRDVLISEKSPADEQNDTLFQFGFGTWSWHGTGTNTNQNGSGGWWQSPSADRMPR